MVGLTAAVENYFIFIAILFAFNVVMNQLLSIFAATARTKTDVQSMGAVILLFLILFSGFIVSPDVIPSYYIWIYWLNPLAWVYRAMLVNEFRSSEYDSLVDGSNLTSGELILVSQGFTDGTCEKGHVPKSHAEFLFERVFVFFPDVGNSTHIYLIKSGKHGCFLLGSHEPLGNLPT